MSTQPISLGIRWSEVAVQPNTLPEGNYQFTLLGGKTDDNGRTFASAAVADGEFTGKRLNLSYPNFAQYEWGQTEFKRLSIALGMEIQDEEDPVEFLQRATGSTFTARVKHRADQTDPDRKFADVVLSSVRPG